MFALHTISQCYILFNIPALLNNSDHVPIYHVNKLLLF